MRYSGGRQVSGRFGFGMSLGLWDFVEGMDGLGRDERRWAYLGYIVGPIEVVKHEANCIVVIVGKV